MQDGYIFFGDASFENMYYKDDSTLSVKEMSPPWIVVTFKIKRVGVTKWPGKLWRASVLEGGDNGFKNAYFARAASVRLIEEIPTSLLFGDHGSGVCRLISQVQEMELKHVEALSDAHYPETAEFYDLAWKRWSVNNSSGSPINDGFSLLSSILEIRAETVAGMSAFIEVAEEGKCLNKLWTKALHEIFNVAMVRGAPELNTPEDQQIMLAAWNKVFG